MATIPGKSAGLILAVSLLLPAQALAEEIAPPTRLHLGPVNIELSLTVGVTYTDNAFATAENPESDFFLIVTPGIRLTFGEEYKVEGFTFGITAETANADNFSELNRIDWEIYGKWAHTFGERLWVEIGDTYTPAHLEPLESTSGELESYTSNEAYVNLRYDFLDLWQLRLGYSRTDHTYADSENRSRVEDLISSGLYFRILAKTSLFASYGLTLTTYDDPASTLDNTEHDATVGVTWEITELTRGTVEFGYQAVSFDDPAEGGWDTWGASIEIRHALTELTNLRVRGERDIGEGKYEETRYTISSGVAAELEHRFLDRLTGYVRAGYFIEEFSDPIPGETETREDESFRAELGVDYAFASWLSFSLDYSYLDRSSNIDHYSAIVNTVTLSAEARY